MTPTDFAAEELAMWEQALRDQRAAERRLEEVGRASGGQMRYELLHRIRRLTTRADLLLAEAVKVKRSFSDMVGDTTPF